jgi:hypothetical protein
MNKHEKKDFAMQRTHFHHIGVLISAVWLLMLPSVIMAQSNSDMPPLGQALVSEGQFATALASALGVVNTDDEDEAERQLGMLEIAPRGGWMADYPVTPDILGELQNAVYHAAQADRLSLNTDEAMQKIDAVAADFGLTIRYAGTGDSQGCMNYPSDSDMNDFYDNQGPPVVTYYCPPAYYQGLYEWIPYAFYWHHHRQFPGFFIMRDFHHVTHTRHHQHVITNHFNAPGSSRSFRIDPMERAQGKTFGGIGVPHPQKKTPSGVNNNGKTTIFKETHPQTAPRNTPATPEGNHDNQPQPRDLRVLPPW